MNSKAARSEYLFKTQLFFNAMASTSSITITGVYWGLMDKDKLSTAIHSLHQHGGLGVITFSSLLLSHDPFPFVYVVSTWMFAGTYAIYVYILYSIYGFERDAVYTSAT